MNRYTFDVRGLKVAETNGTEVRSDAETLDDAESNVRGRYPDAVRVILVSVAPLVCAHCDESIEEEEDGTYVSSSEHRIFCDINGSAIRHEPAA